MVANTGDFEYLSVAQDKHEALLDLLQHRAATISASWTMLRPTFESACFAAWILDPPDGHSRRYRGLRVEVRDERENLAHLRTFERLPELWEMVKEAIENRRSADDINRTEAVELGVRWDLVHQKVNVAAELPKLSFTAGDVMLETAMEGTWRMLSGHEHGLGCAMMRVSKVGASIGIPGGAQVKRSFGTFELCLVAAAVGHKARERSERLALTD